MFYSNTKTAIFLSRPNRFLAHVLLNDTEVICHVKNTGRLKELLLPGAAVSIQHHPDAVSKGRKTDYSLIAVSKPVSTGSVWVNIDSQAPNQAAWEWLTSGEGLPFCPRPQNVKREVRYGQSRFDLSFMDGRTPWLMEVKGVTLDANGTAMFPDAPTERGIKHLDELAGASKAGCQTAILFVIQMKGIRSFSPNRSAHPGFADALLRAANRGVHIWAYDCLVTENTMKIDRPVSVILS